MTRAAHLVVRIVALLVISVSFSGAAATSAAQTESALGLVSDLPDRQGVYAWSDDAQGVFDALFEFVSDSNPDDDLDELIEDLERDDNDHPIGRQLSKTATALRMLREGAFDSAVCWIYASNDGNIFEHSFVAHSRLSAEEMDEFMGALPPLIKEMRLGSIDSPDQLDDEFGYWTYEGGWLVWSESESERDLLRLSLDHDATRPLANNREFQRIHANLTENQRSWPGVSFYVSSRSTPGFLIFGHPFTEFIDFRHEAAWADIGRAAFLEEIRGVGGTIYAPNPDLLDGLDGLDGTFALDLFFPFSVPRHGPLAAIDSRDGLEFDIPLLDRPLAYLIQVDVDGEKLSAEMAATNERIQAAANLVYAFGTAKLSPIFQNLHSLDKLDGPTAPELLQATNRVLSVGYFNAELDDPLDNASIDSWTAIQIAEQYRAWDLISHVLNAEHPGTWSMHTDDSVAQWTLAPTVSAEMEQSMEQQLEDRIATGNMQFDEPISIRISVENVEQSPNGNGLVLRMPNLVDAMKDHFRRKLARYQNQAYVCIDHWLFVRPVHEANLKRLENSRSEDPSDQLEDVRKSVERLASEFEVTPSGLMVQWPHRFRQNLATLTAPRVAPPEGDPQAPSSDSETERSIQQSIERLNHFRQSFGQSMGHLVLVLEDQRTGIRLVGSLGKQAE